MSTSDDDWKELLDESSGKKYYYNSVTNETQWDVPPPTPLAKKNNNSTNTMKEYLTKALFDFDGDASQNQLSFRKDDLIFIVEEMTTGWSGGRDLSGHIGYLPSLYVVPIEGPPINNLAKVETSPLLSGSARSDSSSDYTSFDLVDNTSPSSENGIMGNRKSLALSSLTPRSTTSSVDFDDASPVNTWIEVYDKDQGKNYFYNPKTKESSWDPPPSKSPKSPTSPGSPTSNRFRTKSSSKEKKDGPPPVVAPKPRVQSLERSNVSPKISKSGHNSSHSAGVIPVPEETISGRDLLAFEVPKEMAAPPMLSSLPNSNNPPPMLSSSTTNNKSPATAKRPISSKAFSDASLLISSTLGMSGNNLIKSESDLSHPIVKSKKNLPVKPSPSPSAPSLLTPVELAKQEMAQEREIEKQVSVMKLNAVSSMNNSKISMNRGGGDTHSHLLPVELKLEIESFSINGYASMYFNRKEGKKPMFGKRRPSMEDLLSFSAKPLTNTLNRLPAGLEEEALVVFKDIMNYMGDGSGGGEGSAALRKSICKKAAPVVAAGVAQASTELGDEIYCQLMKQTTNNPRIDSAWRGWQLLAAVSAVAPPGEHLYNYVIGYMVSVCKQTDLCGSLATFALRKLLGEDGAVTDETLNEASMRIPSKGIYEGSVDGVVHLEATASLLYSQALLPKGSGDFGAVANGVKGKAARGAYQVSCPALLYRDLLTLGANLQKKYSDEKNYSDRWIQLSTDLKFFLWKKNVKDKAFKSLELSKVDKVITGIPKVYNAKTYGKDEDKFSKTTFTLVTLKNKDNLDFIAAAEPERDLWVTALNGILVCDKLGHSHKEEEYDQVKLNKNKGSIIPVIHTVPRVVSTLVNCIISTGGFETEGVFRKSVANSDETKFTSYLNGGYYDKMSNCEDPLVAAALLKKWLRSLTPFLIPDELYEPAIRAGESEDPEQCLNVVKKLRLEAFSTMEYICKFLNALVKYESVTKMGPLNLSVCIAPNILRCPSNDPKESLKNNKLELKFFEILIINAAKIARK